VPPTGDGRRAVQPSDPSGDMGDLRLRSMLFFYRPEPPTTSYDFGVFSNGCMHGLLFLSSGVLHQAVGAGACQCLPYTVGSSSAQPPH
jgi:hypothetical protein